MFMRRSPVVLVTLVMAASALARAADPEVAPSDDARDRIFYPSDTERVKPLARKLAGNIWLDQKAIWTSPFHINRRNAKWWLLAGTATAALVATDNHTINTFKNAPTQLQYSNDVSRVGAGYTVLPVVAGFYLAGAIFDDAKARETGVLGAEALLDGLIVQSVLKPIAGRDRPDVAHNHQKWFDGGASFPSGHSIAAWSLASIISHEYSHKKWVPFVAYGLATAVGTARFGAQQHYASDIFAGSAIGWFIGRYVYQTHQDHSRHIHRLTPHLAPLLQPSAGTYGLAVTFSN